MLSRRVDRYKRVYVWSSEFIVAKYLFIIPSYNHTYISMFYMYCCIQEHLVYYKASRLDYSTVWAQQPIQECRSTIYPLLRTEGLSALSFHLTKYNIVVLSEVLNTCVGKSRRVASRMQSTQYNES